MTKKRKTRAVEKDQYRAFLAKAKDFASMMDISLEEGKWNSAGLQAVHSDDFSWPSGSSLNTKNKIFTSQNNCLTILQSNCIISACG